MGNGVGNRQEAAATAGFPHGTLRCVARWQAGDIHYGGRFRTRAAVDRRRRRKFFAAPPFGAGLHSSAFRPGWRNLLRRRPCRRYVLQTIKADDTGLHKIVPDRVVFLYAISPDGKWVAAWVGADVILYSTSGGPATRVCTGCASGGAENRGVTPPLINWSRDGKTLYLFSGPTAHSYLVPLQAGQILPNLPPEGRRILIVWFQSSLMAVAISDDNGLSNRSAIRR